MARTYQLNAEWKFLQSLCAPELPAPDRLEFCLRLPPEAFVEIEHRIIFHEICALTAANHLAAPRDLREQLPARLTARGFPDLDFDDLLHSENPAPQDAAALVEKYFLRLAS